MASFARVLYLDGILAERGPLKKSVELFCPQVLTCGPKRI